MCEKHPGQKMHSLSANTNDFVLFSLPVNDLVSVKEFSNVQKKGLVSQKYVALSSFGKLKSYARQQEFFATMVDLEII